MRAGWSVLCWGLAFPGVTQPLIEAGRETSLRLIGGEIEFLEDTSAVKTAEEIRESDAFGPSTASVPNLGVSNSAFWFRFTLKNAGDEDRVYLSIPQPDVAEIDLFGFEEGRLLTHLRAGQGVPLSAWDRAEVDHVFALAVPSGGAREVLLRVRSGKLLRLPLYVGGSEALNEERIFRDGFGGAFVGVILVMILYNLFVFLSIRDRSYLIYVVYITLAGLTQADFLGICKRYLWPEATTLATSAAFVLTIITAAVANIFMQRFIQTDRYTPKLARFSWVLYGIFAIGLAMKFGGVEQAAYHLLQVATGTMALYQLVVATVAVRRGSRPARYFLIAWTVFLLGIMVYVLKDLDALPYTMLTKYTMTVGAAVEAVLLSFGLADKINALRKEKERSQADALRASLENERIIREQNVMLEHKVKERTHELQESNEHLKRTQTQLVNAEKMAGLGQLTAGIAHEINNPVNFISSNIPPLRRNIVEMMEVLQQYRSIGGKIDADEVKAIVQRERELGIDDSIAETGEILNSIENGASRTAEIVRGLRNFSRLDEGDLKTADINEGVRSTLAVLSPQVRDLVRIELDLGQLPVVECYPGKLNQVFMNVLTNAAQAVKARHPQGGGTVSVSTRTIGEHVVISVRDNGDGFTPEVKGRMFEPFFTTKGVGEGTGLGLSIAYGIMEKHHGTIEGEDLPEGGAEFRIILPINQTSNARRA